MAHTSVGYMSGFDNEFATEAVSGALPQGRNSPQRPPLGLYAELLSVTAFTVPRAESRRTWFYRIRPSAAQGAFRRIDNGDLHCALAPPNPNRLRWDPLPIPAGETDFLGGLATMGSNCPAEFPAGCTIHIYRANSSMTRVFCDADGELLIVPELGGLEIASECGMIQVSPGEIVVVPRGMRFRVRLLCREARGYICENHEASFRLPELGPLGSNGLANPRDFLTPVAAFEDRDEPTELVQKFQGALWATTLDHSPLDVVAWHGNAVPYKYDLAQFNAIGTVTFDHPDPSINTLLTSPTSQPGIANVDLAVFVPRWLVGEDTFRPPWFHRNVMNEYMGLIQGTYDAKAQGFTPGGSSLHNCMSPHGPDAATTEAAMNAQLEPRKVEGGFAFMFESSRAIRPTVFAMQLPQLQDNYDQCWDGIRKLFNNDIND